MKKKQFTNQQILNAILETIRMKDYPPTIEEIRQFVGAGSKRTILRYLNDLEAQGWIKRWKGARGIKVLKDNSVPSH